MAKTRKPARRSTAKNVKRVVSEKDLEQVSGGVRVPRGLGHAIKVGSELKAGIKFNPF